MKQLSFTFLFCLLALASHAQTVIDTVQYRIHYAVKMQMSKEHYWVKHDDEHCLDIGRQISHYYSRWLEGNQVIIDSMRANGASAMEAVMESRRIGFPTSFFHFDIFKNYPSAGACTVTLSLLKDFRYDEVMQMPEWDPLVGDTIIEGYRCQPATTTFRGKTWRVWYAPDIPISDGPLKLYGLPGLILKAEDTEHEFAFSCIGIKKDVGQPLFIRSNKYVKTSPVELQALQILKGNNYESFINQIGGRMPMAMDGTPVKYPSRTPCLWEYYETK